MTETATETASETVAAGTTDAVQRYLRFWNADPGEEQRQLATGVFRDDVEYHAPIGVRTGVDELVELSGQFAEHFGDIALRARTEPEVVRDRARLRWELLRGDESFAEGTDVLVVDDRGRIASVTTFLDRVPEGFDPHGHA